MPKHRINLVQSFKPVAPIGFFIFGCCWVLNGKRNSGNACHFHKWPRLGVEYVKVLRSIIDPEAMIKIPFGLAIDLTLTMAIVDLGKTTLEEAVLLDQDILRHSLIRRTLTRFIAAIIIAVSIEALLLVSLGVYVYPGSKAEGLLVRHRVLFRKKA